MRQIRIIESVFDYGILPYEVIVGHKIKEVNIKNGQVFNNFMIVGKEENEDYFRMINTQRFVVEIISDEDNWNENELIDLCPSHKMSYNYKVTRKQILNNKIEYYLKYCSHINNYYECKCSNCDNIILYENKYCKYCGNENLNIIPECEYDNAIEIMQ